MSMYFIHQDVRDILKFKAAYLTKKEEFIGMLIGRFALQERLDTQKLHDWLTLCVGDAELITEICQRIDKVRLHKNG